MVSLFVLNLHFLVQRMYDFLQDYKHNLKKTITMEKRRYVMTSFYPNYNLTERISGSKLATGFNGIPSMRMDSIDTKKNADFKTVFAGMVDNFNKELNAPDNLLKDVMSGNKNIDVHDVMIAMSKSEISVNVATTAVGKVIQAYDKIMQIQV